MIQVDGSAYGELTMSDCRASFDANAVLYSLDIHEAGPFVITVAANFNQHVDVLDSTGATYRTAKDDWRVAADFQPGRYYVRVSSMDAGEIGPYTLSVRKGDLSRTEGLLIGIIGSGGSDQVSVGNLPVNQGGFRAGLGLGPYIMAIAEYTVQGGANLQGSSYFQYGGRLWLRTDRSRLRPYGQYTVGKMDYTVPTGPDALDFDLYNGTGNSIGGGFEYFGGRHFGIDIGVFHSTGTLTKDGGGAQIDLNETRGTAGIQFHF